MNAKEESQPFTENYAKTKKSSWKLKLWLEANKITVYLLFLISILVSCFSILKLYSFSFDTSDDDGDEISANETVNGNQTSEADSITMKEIQKSTFSIIFFLTSSIGISYISQKVKTPGLLGILLLGIAFRNVTFLNRNLLINDSLGSLFRKFAFLIILLRSGLGLDAKALMKLKGSCILLAFLPCTFEAFTVAILSLLIFGMKFSFGLLLGFILATVTTAVIVPAVLDLQNRNLGVAKGIPTLITAAASIDDVYAITWFSLIMSSIAAGSTDEASSPFWTIIQAPLEVLAGIGLGCILGALLWIFPHPELPNLKLRRMALLLAFSCAALFGSDYLGYDTAGPFAVLVLGFIAALHWNRQQEDAENLMEEKMLKEAWEYFGEPLLFCLIGYQLDLNELNKSNIFQCLIILAGGLFIRGIFTYLALIKTKLNVKEKFFVAIAWLPKATVQAALAPVLLEMVRKNPAKFGKYKPEAIIILTISILSILITAPAGALLIRMLGPLLLSKKKSDNDEKNSVEMEECAAKK